jgi:hypothetical protein
MALTLLVPEIPIKNTSFHSKTGVIADNLPHNDVGKNHFLEKRSCEPW